MIRKRIGIAVNEGRNSGDLKGVDFSRKRKIGELLIGFVLLGLMSVLAQTRTLESFENLMLDAHFRVRGEKSFPDKVTMIGIDEASLDAFGRWPWPRSHHAQMLRILRHRSFLPAILSYDMLFEQADREHPEGDEALAHEVSNMPVPVLLAYFFERGSAWSHERNEAKEVLLEKFALASKEGARPPNLEQATMVSVSYLDVASHGDLAFVNAPVDADGRSRRMRLLMEYRGRVYPSFSLLSAMRYLGIGVEQVRLMRNAIRLEPPDRPAIVIPVTDEGDLLINYYCRSRRIPQLSYLDVLHSGKAWMEGEGLPDQLKSLHDKVVLVGVTALGLEDRRVTPFFEYEPGVSMQAQAIVNIIQSDFLRRAPIEISLLTLILTGLLAVMITTFLRITASLPAIFGLGLLYMAFSHLLFRLGVWIDGAVVLHSIVVIFIGITSFRYFTTLEELKQTQQQLIHSAKMASLGQLSAGIAHEFRNILNAINLHVEYASRPGLDPEKAVKYIEKVRGIVQNASRILISLLTFARKNESVKAPGDLKKTIEETLTLVQKEMVRHHIQVDSQLDDVREISYDAGQVSQVIMNLMNNARDAIAEQETKKILIRLKEASKGAIIDIGDNGPGISPAVMKRLFEPFVTSKEAGKGTGLGLSVCHGIIRNHGGEITVTTEQGQGTTWHIFIPG